MLRALASNLALYGFTSTLARLRVVVGRVLEHLFRAIIANRLNPHRHDFLPPFPEDVAAPL